MKPKRPDPFDPLDGAITDTLDLHGLSAVQARSRLDAYLKHFSQRHSGGLVHIITGRGRNSTGEPVLKPAIRRLLKANAFPQVSSWGIDDDEGGYLVRVKGGSF